VSKYMKKPIVIEAFQMTKERRKDNSEWPDWMNRAWNFPATEEGSLHPSEYPNSDGTDELEITTLEGNHRVSWNDWIIQGIRGELYSCKPDIFEETYSAMPGEATP